MTLRIITVVLLLLTTSLSAQDKTPTQRLTEQSKQFEEQIIKVADNVYTAVRSDSCGASKSVLLTLSVSNQQFDRFV